VCQPRIAWRRADPLILRGDGAGDNRRGI
jgi:hypothetical protein